MDKGAIRSFALEARKILMKSAITEAGFYGVTKDGCKAPIQKGNDFEVYETLAGTENRIYGHDIKRRANLVKAVQEQGFDQVIEETAYTWFNRIIAIRFMEVNDYLPTRVRVLSSETGSNTPDIVTQSLDVDLNMTSEEMEKVQNAKDNNRYDEAFRLLFIKQCNELNDILPGLFERTDDYMELLLKLSYTNDGVVRMLVDTIPVDDFNVEKEGQVEIIGWMYQYYNTELKDDTFAKLKKNVKISKERIPAVTQLFTPDWIVRYMVENSLGKVWIEHLKSKNNILDEKSVANDFGWKYYIPESRQNINVEKELVEINKSYEKLTPKDLMCIDPCMGSGHILIYMFDVLMDIYRSEGFNDRDAVFDILKNNIYGLDIDKRAYQLSYFALMMKARSYNRRFFIGSNEENGNTQIVEPKVYAFIESKEINKKQIDYLISKTDANIRSLAAQQIEYILDTFYNAKELGSILKIGSLNFELLDSIVSDISEDGQISIESYDIDKTKEKIEMIIKISKILVNKYHAVVTNPPYMGGAGMQENLATYLSDNYETGKYDLFSAFIIQVGLMCKKNGYVGLLTPYVWMFISSYSDLREYLVRNMKIKSLTQLEYNAFPEACVPVCIFTMRKSNIIGEKSSFIKLSDFKGVSIQEPKTLEAINDINCKYRYEIDTNEFLKIPGTSIAYWLKSKTINIFQEGNALANEASIITKGIFTGDNNRFLRLWFEISIEDIGEHKWNLYCKGGAFRRWYGNIEYVVLWEEGNGELRNYSKSGLGASKYFGKNSFVWSKITNSLMSFRINPKNVFFDDASPAVIFNDDMDYYLLGLMNSKAIQYYLNVLSPTMNNQIGDIKKVPVLRNNEIEDKIVYLVKENIELAKKDFDSFETSFEFKMHPLAQSKCDTIEDIVEEYKLKQKADAELMKYNEEDMNNEFIRLYNLNDVIYPDVEEDNISINIINDKEVITSFISFAVGCMFGRYSLDYEGIAYAGGKWKDTLYLRYLPVKDNIILISDEDNFNDDIVSKFVDFVKTVFGNEKLENNLRYIAKCLVGTEDNARKTIREYFVNKFFEDHCNYYTSRGAGKRPIYWLFDSGKENGFKALIYMHRYNRDTVGIIRSDYLLKVQDAIERSLQNAEYIISTTSTTVEKAKATKARDRYIKQLNEIKTYYQALSHVALQRIEIDLDDGVKVNYAKFQGIEVSNEGTKKQTIDLLAKI